MSNISVIIPVLELNDKTNKYLDNAILSIAEQNVLPKEVIIVTPDFSGANLTNFDKIKDFTEIVINKGDDTDFCTQVNLGVESAKGKFFSILELDDEYSKIWFKNVELYRNENPDVDAFLPITVEMTEDGNFLDLTNQPSWAPGFNEQQPLGFLEHDRLLEYQNFSIGGAVIKKSKFQELGGLKPSIKLTFIYEFLLRLTLNKGSVLTIPRIGYKHVAERKDGLLVTTLDGMDAVERKWWLDKAKKEFYFNNDRKISYEA